MPGAAPDLQASRGRRLEHQQKERQREKNHNNRREGENSLVATLFFLSPSLFFPLPILPFFHSSTFPLFPSNAIVTSILPQHGLLRLADSLYIARLNIPTS